MAGTQVCSHCRPTRLRQWLTAVGFTVTELAAACRVSRDTVQVAMRGEPISKRAAKSISERTKVPFLELRLGRVAMEE